MGLAEEVGASFGATGSRLGVKDATLTLYAPGARTSASGGTNPTSTTHACKGFVGSYAARLIDGTIVKAEDRRICLFASTIADGAVPVQGAKIEIGGETYRVISVGLDPAGALYACQARR